MLAVVYLIFNEGFGDDRIDLSAEAIQLGRALAQLMPDEPEALALLALMLLHDARRAARFEEGSLVLLDDQDRARGTSPQSRRVESCWTAQWRCKARALTRCRRRSPTSICGSHGTGTRIAALYGTLARGPAHRSCELNRAIAVAELERPRGRARDPRRAPRWTTTGTSTRPERPAAPPRPRLEAREAYEHAIELTQTEPERRFLADRITELEDARE